MREGWLLLARGFIVDAGAVGVTVLDMTTETTSGVTVRRTWHRPAIGSGMATVALGVFAVGTSAIERHDSAAYIVIAAACVLLAASGLVVIWWRRA